MDRASSFRFCLRGCVLCFGWLTRRLDESAAGIGTTALTDKSFDSRCSSASFVVVAGGSFDSCALMVAVELTRLKATGPAVEEV